MATYIDRDLAFGVDKFGRPNLSDANQTLINNLITILIAKPGNFPSQPTLGLDIWQYIYNNDTQFSPTALKAKLVSQCTDFADCVNDGTFDIKIKSTTLGHSVILIDLPVKVANTNRQLSVGIYINQDNEQIYRFIFTDETEVEQFI